MPTSPDQIPENIDFAAQELFEAPADQRPAMLENIAKALTRRLLKIQALGSVKSPAVWLDLMSANSQADRGGGAAPGGEANEQPPHMTTLSAPAPCACHDSSCRPGQADGQSTLSFSRSRIQASICSLSDGIMQNIAK
jgi:hypothetical protein